MTTRRQFLERSAWGFGSAFLLPSLLASCTDHLIPPDKPINPPLGEDLDWNYYTKELVGVGLEQIPIVGSLLSGLVGIFWPTPEDSPWAQIQAQVNELINQKLGDNDFEQASGTLDGLRLNVQDYLQELTDGTPSEINNKWSTVKEIFANVKGDFKVDPFEVKLLPLYTQYANLNVILLREPLLPKRDANGGPIVGRNGGPMSYGESWGMTDADLDDALKTLQDFITEAISYVYETYTTGRYGVINNVPTDNLKVEPFKSTNAYDRTMTLLVLDYMDTWQYYNIERYRNGAKNFDSTPIPLFTREIYSDPYGSLNSSGPIVLPSQPTQFPTQITVWGGQRIDAVQLTYPAGGGPNGVTTTPRMGDASGGSTNAPQGGIVDIPSGLAITSAFVSYNNTPEYKPDNSLLISTLQFKLTGGNTIIETNQFGGAVGQYQSGEIKYTPYALSSIYIHGPNDNYENTSSDCIVFGFMRQR